MKKFISLLALYLIILVGIAQESITVEVKGVGLRREDALQDALRNAVSQAIGVSLISESRVENFVLIQDAINTRTQGYVENYRVIRETPLANRFEVTISATVGLKPLRADINLLSAAVGGIRFLVMYDPRMVGLDDQINYDFAVERFNEYLSNRRYRYIDKRRFDQLRDEAMMMFREGGDEASFVQRLGLTSDAQFIILIRRISISSREEAFGTRTSSRVVIEASAFDNCTAEGLGTIVLESDWISNRDGNVGIMAGIQSAVLNNADRLLGVFTSYIGDWVNNGTPFELRFYQSGGFRDFRELRRLLTEKPEFGGQMEIVSVNNYTKLNVTFKKRPDALADAVLDIADRVPAFRDRMMDVKFIYGRQISFAPQNAVIPELQITRLPEPDPAPTSPSKGTSSPSTSTTSPSSTTYPSTAPARTPSTSPAKGKSTKKK